MKAGDKVHWTESKRVGSGIRFTRRDGRLIAIFHGFVTVKYRGRFLTLPRESVRAEDQPSEISDIVKEMGR